MRGIRRIGGMTKGQLALRNIDIAKMTVGDLQEADEANDVEGKLYFFSVINKQLEEALQHIEELVKEGR